MNYWYQELTIVNESTLDYVNNKMPSKYAAMSHFEFLAELYAIYYDLDDPMRQHISQDIIQWFDENLDVSDPSFPSLDSVKPAHRSGGKEIVRPS